MKSLHIFRKKRTKSKFDSNAATAYDKASQIPTIRASICNGEQIAGFKDIQTGKFKEELCIRTPRDLEEFLQKYGIDKADLKKEW